MTVVTPSTTDRTSGAITVSLTERRHSRRLLSGDMTDGDDIRLLSGDATDGDDVRLLSGDVTRPAASTTDRTSAAATTSSTDRVAIIKGKLWSFLAWKIGRAHV